jgi:hypothetical protein
VRTALLTPIRVLGDRTFIEVAGTRDGDDLRAAADSLLSEEGGAAIEKHWHRTRPLGGAGRAASEQIQESIDRRT